MLDVKKHREALFNLLREIYQSPAGAWLGFKGGTMLYFFYGLDRFSVDLDFDLLAPEKGELVRREVRLVASRYGTIKDDSDKKATIFFLLDYQSGERNIKIEISKRLSPLNSYEIKNFYGTDVKTLKLADAFAQKLIAATERRKIANRDFYDIHFLLKKGAAFNEKIIEDRSKKSVGEYLLFLKDFILNKRTEGSMLEGLGELVEPDKKNWVKKSLKVDLLARLEFIIDTHERISGLMGKSKKNTKF